MTYGGTLNKKLHPDYGSDQWSNVDWVIDDSEPLSHELIAYYDARRTCYGLGPKGRQNALVRASTTYTSPAPIGSNAFLYRDVDRRGQGESIRSEDTGSSSELWTDYHSELSGAQEFTFMHMCTFRDLSSANTNDLRYTGTSITNGYFFRLLSSGTTIEWIMNGFGGSDRVSISGLDSPTSNDVLWVVGQYKSGQKLKVWARQNYGTIKYNESSTNPTGTYTDNPLKLMLSDGDEDFISARLWKRALSDAEVRAILKDPYRILKPHVSYELGIPSAGGGGPTPIPPRLQKLNRQFATIIAHRLGGALQ